MDLTEGSETSSKLNQTPGKYPKENIQVSEHGENLKSRNYTLHTDFIIPYVSEVFHERINKHHNNLEAPSQPTIRAIIATYKH
jgi:hypothetical protein